jgi:hypothetical protein
VKLIKKRDDDFMANKCKLIHYQMARVIIFLIFEQDFDVISIVTLSKVVCYITIILGS